MPTLTLCKIICNTKLWKKGQKVWIIARMPYATRSEALGRYKGNGRWITAYIAYNAGEYSPNGIPNAKLIGSVEVSEEFIKYLSQFDDRVLMYLQDT